MDRLLVAVLCIIVPCAGHASSPPPMREVAFGPERVVAPDREAARQDAKRLAESAAAYFCEAGDRKSIQVEVQATASPGEYFASGRLACFRAATGEAAVKR